MTPSSISISLATSCILIVGAMLPSIALAQSAPDIAAQLRQEYDNCVYASVGSQWKAAPKIDPSVAVSPRLPTNLLIGYHQVSCIPSPGSSGSCERTLLYQGLFWRSSWPHLLKRRRHWMRRKLLAINLYIPKLASPE